LIFKVFKEGSELIILLNYFISLFENPSEEEFTRGGVPVPRSSHPTGYRLPSEKAN